MKRIIIASALAMLSATPAISSERFIDGLSWTNKYSFGKFHFSWDFDAGKLFRTNLKKGKRDRNTDVRYGNSYQAPWQTSDVKREWRLGWKGQKSKVGIIDNFRNRPDGSQSHGEMVHTVIKGGISGGKYVSGIAPAAEVTKIQRPPSIDLKQFDVINVSYDVRGNSQYSRLAAEGNTGRALENSGAVVTIAAGNSSASCRDITKCSNIGMAVTGDATSGQYIRNAENTGIIVGTTNHYSNKAGILRKDYILADGSGPRVDNGYGGYREMTGTSFAAPKVAATAALIKSKFPKANSIGIKKLILESADGMGKCAWIPKKYSCSDDRFGHGMLNVRAALSPVGKLR